MISERQANPTPIEPCRRRKEEKNKLIRRRKLTHVKREVGPLVRLNHDVVPPDPVVVGTIAPADAVCSTPKIATNRWSDRTIDISGRLISTISRRNLTLYDTWMPHVRNFETRLIQGAQERQGKGNLPPTRVASTFWRFQEWCSPFVPSNRASEKKSK